MPTKYLLSVIVAVAASFSVFADEPESAKPNLAPGGSCLHYSQLRLE